MSKSLLKRSLEIVEASSSSSNRTSGKSSKQARNPFAPPSSTEQLAIYRGSVGKPSAAKAKGTRSAAATVPAKSAKSVKSAIQVAHEHIRNGQNRVDENLTKLLMFSAVKLDEATTTKLIRRAQNRKYVIPVAAPKADEASAFTDEDFAKFEREYFCS